MKALFCALLLVPVATIADEAEIVSASARASGDSFTISVTLRHGDTGWDDYADGWEVLDASGARLGFRELLHPHVNEQPFTRSQSGIRIPQGTAQVFIRSRTNADGWGDTLFALDLP